MRIKTMKRNKTKSALYVALAVVLAITAMNLFHIKGGASAFAADSAKPIIAVPSSGQTAVINPEDTSLIHEISGTGVNNGRYADNDDYFTYCAQFADFGADAKGYLAFKSSGASLRYRFDVSTDNQNYAVVYDRYETTGIVTDNAIAALGRRYFDLSTLLQASTDGKIYFRIGSSEAGGWGGHLINLQFASGELPALDPTVRVDKNEVSVNAGEDGYVNADSNSQVNAGGRYTDYNNWFNLKVKYTQDTVTSAFVKLELRGDNRKMSVSATESADGKRVLSYTDMADANGLSGAQFYDGTYYYFDITAEVNASPDKTAYVWFEAQDKTKGNGSHVSYVTFLKDFETPVGTGTSSFEAGKMLLNIPAYVNSFVHSTEKGLIKEFNSTGAGRAVDGTNTFEYKVIIPASTTFSYAHIVAAGRKQIDVSKDGGTTWKALSIPGVAVAGDLLSKAENDGAVYKDILKGEGSDNNIKASYYFSLDSFLNGATETELLFRFGRYSGDKVSLSNYCTLFAFELWQNTNYDTAVTMPTNYKVDIQSLNTGSEKETAQIDWVEGTGYAPDQGIRYIDRTEKICYKFNIDPTAAAVKLIVDVKAGYLVSVSTDGENFTDVGISSVSQARWRNAQNQQIMMQDANAGLKQYNISSVTAGKSTLYVRIGDATVDGDFGACLSSLKVMSILNADSGTTTNKLFAEGKLMNEVAVYDNSLLHKNNNSQLNFTGRSVVGNASFEYKFELPSDATSFFMAMSVAVANNNNELKVRVSKDGNNYADIQSPATNITLKKAQYSNSSILASYTVDLGYFLATSKTIFVEFSAAEGTYDDTPVTVASLYTGYNTIALRDGGTRVTEFNKKQYQTFITGTDAEVQYIHSMSAKNILGDKGENGSWLDRNSLWPNKWDPNTLRMPDDSRMLNKEAFAVYKFQYNPLATQINLIGEFANTYRISVSKDDSTYTDIAVASRQYLYKGFMGDAGADLSVSSVEIDIDISEFKNENNTVYIKITSAIDDSVSGANYKSLGVASYWDAKPVPVKAGGCKSSVNGMGGLVAVAIVTLSVAALLVLRKRKNDIKIK